MADFLPTDEKALAGWLENFARWIPEFTSTLGLTEAQTRSAKDDATALSHLIRAVETAGPNAASHPEAYRQLVEFKDLMKNGPREELKAAYPTLFTPEIQNALPGVFPRLIAFIDDLLQRKGYTEAIGKDLDIADTGVPLADKIPTGDNELIGWMKTFVGKLAGHTTALGVTAGEVDRVQKDHDNLAALVKAVDQELNDRKGNPKLKELIDFKDFIKWGLHEKAAAAFPAVISPVATAVAPAILPRLLPLLERLAGSGTLTAAAASALGLPLPARPVEEERKERVVPVASPAPVAAAAEEAPSAPKWLLPLLGLLALGGIGWFLSQQRPAEPTATPTAVVVSPAAPAEPKSLKAIVAERKPEDVLALYERGATAWFEPAAAEFNSTQTGGRILIASLGSREGRDHILYDKEQIQPVLWVPGDIYWVDKLRSDAADPKISPKSGATVGEGKALLKTYIVLLMKEDRAKVFETALQKPEYKNRTFKLLADIAEKGWTAAGGPADWGKLKWTHSNPSRSNSGMMTLALMFAEFRRDNPGKDINSAEFKKMMSTLESATGGNFASTTSDSLTSFLDTAGGYDAVVVYESDAVQALEKGLPDVKIVYPTPTAVVILPAGVVKGAWVNEKQTELATKFVDYLLSESVQEKAIAVGYRPATEALRAKVEEFYKEPTRAGAGMKIAPDYQGTEVDSRTKEGLIFNWSEWYKTTYNKDPMAEG